MTHQTQSNRLAVAGLALATLLPSLGSSIANVALPTLSIHFAATFEAVRWVVLAYLIAMTVAMLFVGWLGDHVERRHLLVVGLAVSTAASLIASAAPSLRLVVAARAMQGVGAAIALALAMVFVGEAVPKERTGRAMGLLGAMSALGTALGPSLGGMMVDAFGWRCIFLANVPLGALAIVLVRRYLPSARPTPRAQRSAFERLRSQFAPFRDRHLRGSLTANLLVSAVLMATLVVGPFYLSQVLALDPASVGGVMSIGPVAAALFGVPAGRLVDHLGARRAVLVGLVGIAIGAAALALLPEALRLPGYIVPIVVVTTSYALFQAANNTEVMRDLGRDQRSVVSGALNLSRNLGLIGGTSLMGAVFAATGIRGTFAVGCGLIVIALFVLNGAYRRKDQHIGLP